MDLTGRTAIVTGAGTGIGRALAVEFARQGANVVCCSRREHTIRETVDLIERGGGDALAIPVDVTDPEQVGRMVSLALDRFGRIDVLFNNAGSFAAIGAVWQIDPDVWWHDVTVNLLGPMLCSRAVLPHMMERDEGIIINMNGGGSGNPLPGGSGYACSKAALLRLTDNMAAELKRVGSSVMVFAMSPGLVRTAMTELRATQPEGLEWIPGTKECFEDGRHLPPEACAEATMKLIEIASPELSGRVFGVGTDFEDVARRKTEIESNDLFSLRFKS